VFSARLDVFLQVEIDFPQLIVFSLETSNLLIPLVDLVDSQSESVLSLVKRLSEIVIAHIFSLRSFLVMYGFALVFISQSRNFSNMILEINELIL
jgi:hypothetical protein